MPCNEKQLAIDSIEVRKIAAEERRQKTGEQSEKLSSVYGMCEVVEGAKDQGRNGQAFSKLILQNNLFLHISNPCNDILQVSLALFDKSHNKKPVSS